MYVLFLQRNFLRSERRRELDDIPSEKTGRSLPPLTKRGFGNSASRFVKMNKLYLTQASFLKFILYVL